MIVEIDGKTFHKWNDNHYTRQKDKNYYGKKTNYFKCEACGKLVAQQWRERHRWDHTYYGI